MNPRNKGAITLARAGMELSWRYAWVVYLSLLTTRSAFPFALAVYLLFLGALTARLAEGGRRRVYQVILWQTAGFIFSFAPVWYWIQYHYLPSVSVDRIAPMFMESETACRWLLMSLNAFYLWLLWRGGRLVVKIPRRHRAICAQFDKGLGFFILLLIIHALIDRRTDVDLQVRAIGYMFLAFLVFGLVSIALVRSRSHVQKTFVVGYHGVGVVLSVLTMTGLFFAGTTLLAAPWIYLKADSLLSVLKRAAAPMQPVLINVILFLFRPGHMRTEAGTQGGDISLPEKTGDVPAEGWEAALFKILSVGLAVVTAILVACLAVYLMRLLVLWLLKKTGDDTDDPLSMAWIWHLMAALQAFFRRLKEGAASLAGRVDNAAMVYVQLQRWGRHSGLLCRPSETPIEYGSRLTDHFPDLAGEIVMIVDAFNREVYGNRRGNRRQLFSLVAAQRRMRRMRHWPMRIGTWFRQ
ncbi:MAG: DUF4129 domain-containing protein [Deltaproteobacteria bacterium]|nr:DUF4129 domain-containing protein [Deltaproteobacteria bacterium]